jgi:Uma2 family endonuclease
MSLPKTKRFTIEEYHRLIEAGFFQGDDRVELIRGVIANMASKGKPHVFCRTQLLRELCHLLGDRATLRCADPVALPQDSEPEPDFAIVRNRKENYLSHHPTPDEILLVIEIADVSLQYDCEVKLPLYAEAGISKVWLFNVLENQLEIYTSPYQNSNGTFNYRQKQVKLWNETIGLPGFPGLTLELGKVFPPMKS